MLRTPHLLIAIFAIALHASPIEAKSFAYISLAGENRIAIYNFDEQTGELTPTGDIKLSGGPGALAVSPSRQFLFASIRSVGNLASFRIDPANGALTLISEVAAGADPAYVMPDKQGRFLLSAFYFAGKVDVHAIGEDGSLSKQAVQSIPTDEKAHAILTDRSNRFAFVPHTGPNAIYHFTFDPRTGNLTPHERQPILQTPDNSGPRHLWFHPTKSVAYVSDEQGSSVSVYNMDSKSGMLNPIQTLSSLPAGYRERNSTADIEVDPSGRFVYIANRGHDSLAAYRVEGSGELALIGHAATEQTPRSFNIEPSGRFLIAAGQGSGKLAVFAIDSDKGTLSRRATYVAGKQPWWVLVVRF